MTRASSSLERSLSDRKDFLRSAWTNSAFTDCTLALSIAPGGSKKPADGPAARYVDCVKFQLAKHSPIFRSAAAAALAPHGLPCRGAPSQACLNGPACFALP